YSNSPLPDGSVNWSGSYTGPPSGSFIGNVNAMGTNDVAYFSYSDDTSQPAIDNNQVVVGDNSYTNPPILSADDNRNNYQSDALQFLYTNNSGNNYRLR